MLPPLKKQDIAEIHFLLLKNTEVRFDISGFI